MYKIFQIKHCVKCVHIRSFSGPYFCHIQTEGRYLLWTWFSFCCVKYTQQNNLQSFIKFLVSNLSGKQTIFRYLWARQLLTYFLIIMKSSLKKSVIESDLLFSIVFSHNFWYYQNSCLCITSFSASDIFFNKMLQ